mmetsp:Transcript_46932/g.82740  ORF Transcript_46932/g.82740 Transcript_46932/m.82740 type:complete len:123 (-) Transcript_46932:50-418(-)
MVKAMVPEVPHASSSDTPPAPYPPQMSWATDQESLHKELLGALLWRQVEAALDDELDADMRGIYVHGIPKRPPCSGDEDFADLETAGRLLWSELEAEMDAELLAQLDGKQISAPSSSPVSNL